MKTKHSLVCILLLTLFALFLTSCSNQEKKEIGFRFPEIIDTLTKSEFYFSPQRQWKQETYIYQINPIDSNVNLNKPERDVLKGWALNDIYNDSVYRISTKTTGLEIFVDTSKEISISRDNFNPPFRFSFIESKKNLDKNYIPTHNDSTAEALISNNVINYNKWIKSARAYPVYIVNNTDSNIVINKILTKLLIIQEAKDTSHRWRPIEHVFNQDFAFNVPYILKPKHYIITKTYKYIGEYKTEVRLKFKNGNTIIYSNPFNGSVNFAQFDYGHNRTKKDSAEYFLMQYQNGE